MSQARILGDAELRALLRYVGAGPLASRNTAIVLLSFKAGLRAGEIAGLDWSMVLSPQGGVAVRLAIPAALAKYRSQRTVPVNQNLRWALRALHVDEGRPLAGPVIRSRRGGHMSAKAVVNWFSGIYAEAGLSGCSSHSGRRTFITNAARQLARVGGSLRDVQELAGHRSLSTTERYIQGDREIQRRLVRLI